MVLRNIVVFFKELTPALLLEGGFFELRGEMTPLV